MLQNNRSVRFSSEPRPSSASEALRNYINAYEQQNLSTLARSITNLCTETPLQRYNITLSSSEISDEIKMAQTLLPPIQPRQNAATISADQLLIEDANFKNSDGPSSSANTSSVQSFRSSHSPNSRKRKQRTRRVISEDSCEADEFSELVTSLRLGSSSDIDDDANVSSQVEDLQRTWRLVNGLKADYMSSERSESRNVPDESLKLLIERLTATARRKEAKLQQMVSSGSLSVSDLISTHKTFQGVSGEDDCQSEDRLSEDSLRSKELKSTSVLESIASSSDVVDDVIRLIDRKKADLGSACMMTPQAPSHTDATETRLKSLTASLPTKIDSPFTSSYRDFSQSVARSREMQRFVNQCLAEASTATPTNETYQKDHPVEALKSMISTLENLSMDSTAEPSNDVMSEDLNGHGSLHRAINHLEKMKKIILN